MTQKSSRTAKKKNLRIVVLAVVLIAAAVAVAVFVINSGKSVDLPHQTESSQTSVKDETKMPVKGEITTPVGKLVYPEEWIDYVQIEDSSSDKGYSACFYATAGEEKVVLFKMYIGSGNSGYLIGSAPDADGNMQEIRFDIKELEAAPSWTDEDTDRLNLMQSCVNDLIDQLHQLEGFRDGN